jgi:hypothetical protein
LAAISPKEAEGGARVRQQNWPFLEVVMSFGGVFFSWKKSPTR